MVDNGKQNIGHNSPDSSSLLDHVCELIANRASGKVSNEEVEQAVSRLLQQRQIPSTSTTATLSTISTPGREPQQAQQAQNELDQDYGNKKISVEQDLEDYDEACEGELTRPLEEQVQSQYKTPPPQQKQQRRRPRLQFVASRYEEIPLGLQGARMLIAFGDGPNPDPVAVQTALLGARRMMLAAIRDARRCQRQFRQEYIFARKKLSQGSAGAVDVPPDILYQLQHGPNLQNAPCGFGPRELLRLFPEEMNAFLRWNQMKDEADEKAEQTRQNSSDIDETVGDDAIVDPLDGGHLRQRAQEFDVRTAKMKHDWYFEFSNVRHQGSFLPRRGRGPSVNTSAEEDNVEWEQRAATTKRGSKRSGVWSHMSLVQVRFLHWVGFHPQGPLPPPNAETTDALAFLAYDFVGQIVERALALRANQDKNVAYQQQLTESDIQRAVEELKPKPGVASQLYFGPGFEDRVEMELEEMLEKGSASLVDDKDQEWHIRENQIFEHLVGHPSTMKSERDVLSSQAAPSSGAAAGATIAEQQQQPQMEKEVEKSVSFIQEAETTSPCKKAKVMDHDS